MPEETTPRTTDAAAEETAVRPGYASAPQLPATFSIDLTAYARDALARSRAGTSAGGSAAPLSRAR